MGKIRMVRRYTGLELVLELEQAKIACKPKDLKDTIKDMSISLVSHPINAKEVLTIRRHNRRPGSGSADLYFNRVPSQTLKHISN